MSKVLVTIFCLIVGTLIAQVPQGINYQAIVRDGAGIPVTTGPVSLDVTITNGSGSFSETHSVTPNQFGLVNFVIGSVNAVAFQAFDFSVLPTTISVDLGLDNLGTQTLQSVPFSLRTAVADSVAGVDLSGLGAFQPWVTGPSTTYNLLDKIGVGTSSPALALEVVGTGETPNNIGTAQEGALRLTGGAGTDLILDIGLEDNTWEAAWLQASYSTDLSSHYPILLNPFGGNIGIGTNSPDYTLDVAGAIGVDEYLYHNDDANTRIRFSPDQILLTTGGLTNVDATPDQTIVFAETQGVESLIAQKRSDDAAGIEKVLGVTNFNKNPTSAGFGAALTFYGTNDAVTIAEMASISADYFNPSDGSESTNLRFYTKKGGGASNMRMAIDYNGQLHLPAYTGATTRMMTIDPAGGVVTQAIPTGDVTGVTAGTGLTGGGTTGAVTVNAIGGSGLTESANDIDLGGALTQNTVITQGAYAFDINLSGLGDFAIQDAGVDKFFVGDNGRVGIGNSAPAEELDVTGDVQVSGTYKYATPKTRYLHLGPWDFQAKDGEQVEIHGGQGYFAFGAEVDLQDPSAFAPIHLPNGATITSVYFYYLDNSVDDLTFEIQSYNTSGTKTSFGTAASTENAFSFNSKTITPVSALTINNYSNKYVAYITSPVTNNAHRIYTVRVAYTVSQAD